VLIGLNELKIRLFSYSSFSVSSVKLGTDFVSYEQMHCIWESCSYIDIFPVAFFLYRLLNKR